MKILIIAPRFPWPLDKGDRLTIYKYTEYFSKRGHEVTLISFCAKDEKINRAKISHLCEDVHIVKLNLRQSIVNSIIGLGKKKPLQISYYKSEEMRKIVRQVLKECEFDVLYAHTIRMAQYIEDITHPVKILAMQVSMGLTYKRLYTYSYGIWKKLFFGIEYLLVRNFEAKLSKKFTSCCLISKTDLKAVERGGAVENVLLNPHGVDHHKFPFIHRKDKTEEKVLIFSGNMGYTPNVDAILYFANKILPFVTKQIPDCKLQVVGRRPARQVRNLGKSDNIEVVGEVKDMAPYLHKATVGIDPMRVGSGLQNKVIEGLATGLPMVVTTIANEGIGAIPGRDLLIGDNPKEFAEQVIRLLKEPQLRVEIAENGRKFIEKQFTWEYFLDQLEKHLLDLRDPELENE